MAFQARYGEKVIINKTVTRTSLDNLLEWAYARGQGRTNDVGFINSKGFEVHHEQSKIGGSGIKLGFDVVLDVLGISKCHVFIHGTSNISLAVSYTNPDILMVHV
jgi:hypothetical protein